jgi:hypothetical protein
MFALRIEDDDFRGLRDASRRRRNPSHDALVPGVVLLVFFDLSRNKLGELIGTSDDAAGPGRRRGECSRGRQGKDSPGQYAACSRLGVDRGAPARFAEHCIGAPASASRRNHLCGPGEGPAPWVNLILHGWQPMRSSESAHEPSGPSQQALLESVGLPVPAKAELKRHTDEHKLWSGRGSHNRALLVVATPSDSMTDA